METDDPEGATVYRLLLAALVMVAACKTPRKPIPEPTVPTLSTTTAAAETPDTVATKKKKVYLTFDDGPNPGTSTVMRIVTAEKAPAAFFIVGEHINGTAWQKAVWDSLRLNPRYELYNHSYSHALHNRFESFYKRPNTVWKDFFRARDSLGYQHYICRTPGRNAWRIGDLSRTDIKTSKPAIDSAAAAGLQFVGWDLQWHYQSPNLLLAYDAPQMMRKIDSMFKNGHTVVPDNLVLLAHDQTFVDRRDSASLVQLIHLIRENNGYELQPLSAYPPVKKALLQ